MQRYVKKFVCNFSPVTPVSSTNKTVRHDITQILLKVVLNTIAKVVSLYMHIQSITLYFHLSISLQILHNLFPWKRINTSCYNLFLNPCD